MQPTLRSQLFINGEYVPAASGKTLPVLNPANNEVLTELAEAGVEDVDRGGWGQVLNFAFSPFLLLLGISPLLVSADERGYSKTQPQLSLMKGEANGWLSELP